MPENSTHKCINAVNVQHTVTHAGSPFYESNSSGAELLSFTPLGIADVAQLVLISG